MGDTAETTPGESVVIDVVANDIDADGTIVPGSVTIVQDPPDGNVVNNLESKSDDIPSSLRV